MLGPSGVDALRYSVQAGIEGAGGNQRGILVSPPPIPQKNPHPSTHPPTHPPTQHDIKNVC